MRQRDRPRADHRRRAQGRLRNQRLSEHAWGVREVPPLERPSTRTQQIRADGSHPGYNSIAFASCRGGDSLFVRLNSDFDLLTPLVGQFLGTQDLYGQAIVTVN